MPYYHNAGMPHPIYLCSWKLVLSKRSCWHLNVVESKLKDLKDSPDLQGEKFYFYFKYGSRCSQNHRWISSENFTWPWRFIEKCWFPLVSLLLLRTPRSGECCLLSCLCLMAWSGGCFEGVFKRHWVLSNQLGPVTVFVEWRHWDPVVYLSWKGRKEMRRSHCTFGKPTLSLGYLLIFFSTFLHIRI